VLLHRRTRALEGAVHSRDRGFEDRRGLARRPAQDIARDQRRALSRREDLERGQERELDRLARHDYCLRLLFARGHLVEQAIRVRTEPRNLDERAEGSWAARRASEHIEADIGCDPVEPGPDRRATVGGVVRPPRPEERLLDGVLRLVERGQHPVAVDVEFAPVPLGEGRECGLPTGERGRDLVGQAVAPSGLTSWTIQVLPSTSWNEMNVA
jgi:hypothetical protein